MINCSETAAAILRPMYHLNPPPPSPPTLFTILIVLSFIIPEIDFILTFDVVSAVLNHRLFDYLKDTLNRDLTSLL